MAIVLLDTSVLSEVMRATPDPRVLEWVNQYPKGAAWISAVTVAEIRVGIAVLTDGERKTALVQNADRAIGEFAPFVASFDGLAAEEFARIVADRRKRGRPISYTDAQIAATARSAGLTLATRNVGDFSDIENLKVIDPWQGTLPIA